MNERDYMDFIDSQFGIDEQRQIDDEMCEYWQGFDEYQADMQDLNECIGSA